MLKLAGMTASLAGRYAADRIARTFLSEDSAREAAKVSAAAAGARIVQTLGELKGAAMKVGQMASMASDLLPKELAGALQSLQKEAPPMAYSVIAAQVEQEFGQPVEALFAHFERVPFAAASIGQVHRARTDDGREVVVKVQYPGVDAAVDSDMAHLKLALRASGLVRLDKAALDATFEEIQRRMHEELDYCNEADNVRAFHAFHHGRHPFVVVPRVVGERSAKRVLTLTYEPGDPLEALDALGYTQAERDLCGTHLWTAADSQSFDFGRIHADPNPANFAFRRDGTVVMYDFGCVKTLAPGMLDNYADLVRTGLHRDWAGLEVVLQRMGLRQPGTEPPFDLYRAVRDWLVAPFIGREDFDFGGAQLERDALRDVLPVAIRHVGALRPVGELVFFNRAIAGHYATLRKMRARVPVQPMLAARISGIEAALGIRPLQAIGQ
jgi:predicted unusual protein kinase regulating ubiquinone biosynthesis (AarF/ABC1/UbiB family)